MKKITFTIIVIGCLLSLSSFTQKSSTIQNDVNPDSLKIRQIRHPLSPKPKYQRFALSGNIRLITILDIGKYVMPIGNDFIPSAISMEKSNVENPRLMADARETTLAFEGNFKTSRTNIHTYIESGFDSNNDFYLRLAYLDIWQFHIGRDWTTFTNLNAVPNQIDYEGPNSLALPKNEMIRYVCRHGSHILLESALEIHPADFTALNTDDPKNITWPDFIQRLTWQNRKGELSLSGLLRNISFVADNGKTGNVLGAGGNLSGIIHLFTSGNGTETDNLLFSVVGGKGINYYINDLSGLGLDAMPLKSSKTLASIGAQGGYTAFQHYWSKKTNSTIIAGYLALSAHNFSGTTFRNSSYLSANLFTSPIPNFTAGIECMYGKCRQYSGKSASTQRIQAMIMYYF